MPGLTGTRLGRYIIQERLGRGGMSEVYLAYDERMHRNVAIKVVSSSYADYMERFQREAEAIGRLDHAHILPAYDYGEQEPWHFMVMPFIEHGTLRDRLLEGWSGGDGSDSLAFFLFPARSGFAHIAHGHGKLC